MKKSTGSERWLKAHRSDCYVKMAQAQGYRSRAVYKLKEVDEKFQLLRPGITVLELGAAPGGWTQYVAEKLAGRGQMIAVDCLKMAPLPDVTDLQGDFTEDATQQAILALLDGTKAAVLLSDMAPNLSGVAAVDGAKSMALAEAALDSAALFLKPGGTLFMKVFHGQGFDEIVRAVRAMFEKVSVRKPRASRSQSRETYLLACGYRL